MADWSTLGRHLRAGDDEVTLTWRELEEVVGELPRSSIDHPAWWSGDRSHTRAWREAGFEVAHKVPGVSVTFRRRGAVAESRAATDLSFPATVIAELDDSPAPVLLVSCGKAKRSEPAAARDLYTSPRFTKARRFAETSGRSWYILSAEHGLVAPQEWLAPYERFLADTPRDYRRAWAEWVVARLELLVGDLDGVTVEIHAGEDYVAPLRGPLERRGSRIERPLEGLTLGQWSQWYDAHTPGNLAAGRSATCDGPIEPWARKLGDIACSAAPADLPGLERRTIDGPGLYAWFVDEEGARELSSGLGHAVQPGLVYVGQTGATKWPSGRPSGSTLIKRIRSQHLGGNRGSSTLRRTFGAVLDTARGASVSRDELTAWMFAHLRVVPAIVEDADAIADLERRVVQQLDPPLNLDHTQSTPVRVTLRRLRSSVPGQ